jgi:hypothetical protein
MNLQTQSEGARARQAAEQAIALALEGKWEEAVTHNQSLIELNPNDVDAQNRLGKALMELGRFREARDAYSRALAIDPLNSIAKRNLDRLSTIKDEEEPRRAETGGKVAQDLFIEEMGKTGTSLLHGSAAETVARLVAGDEVYLKPDGNLLNVENAQGEHIGNVEPKLGLRLIRLMDGGNRYGAAIKSIHDGEAQLIIKETYRDPTQTKVSFPSAGGEAVRPYIKESLLRYEIEEEEEEETEEEAETEDWDGETETTEPFSLSSLKESIDDDRGDSFDDE